MKKSLTNSENVKLPSLFRKNSILDKGMGDKLI